MIVLYFFVIIITLVVWKILYNKRLNITYIKSNIDNNYYLVRNDSKFTYEQKQEAADFLADLRKELIDFTLFIQGRKENQNKKEDFNRFFSRLDPDNIIEAPDDDSSTSYCINKGEEIAICLRDKEDNTKFHKKNTIIYVILHELAHVMSVSIGHNEEFMENFRFLLRNAIKAKVWNRVDYCRPNKGEKYCGIEIRECMLH